MTTQEIKIGDFIYGSYKYGSICGIVVKVNKSVVVIQQYNGFYNTYTKTENIVNVTKNRIYEVGLEPNGILVNQ
jgi:hypothetical protein